MSEVRTDWQRGQSIPAKDMRANSLALDGLVKSGPDLTSRNGGALRNNARYVVKITAITLANSKYSYQFEQVRFDVESNAYVAASEPVTHETIGEATSQGSNVVPTAGVDEIVSIRPGSQVDSSGRRQWEFIPNGGVSFWAKITGSATNGTNKWKYAWAEQERSSSGWADLTGGRSGTTSTGFALNSIEANNDGTGIQGNSVDIDGTLFDDNTGLEIQPVQGDPVVRMWAEEDTGGTIAYSFEYVNAVDGDCGGVV